jgi:3-oxoadipate enol-lactonase
MPFVTVQHDNEHFRDPEPVRLFWTSEGSGPPLLLVRGLARSHRFFAPIMPYLVEHFTVIRFDNRGSGQSDTPPGRYTTGQMAADCVAILDAAGADSAWVLGMSMGGMIALDMALAHPQRVRGLILGSVNPQGRRAIPSTFTSQILLTISAFAPRKTARRIQAWVTLSDSFLKRRGAEEVSAMMDLWDSWAGMEPFRIKGLLSHTAAIFSHNSGDRLEEIAVPALLMTGELDRLVPPGNSEIMARYIPDAELHIIPDCGHNIETERPEEMIARVTAFITDRESRLAASAK